MAARIRNLRDGSWELGRQPDRGPQSLAVQTAEGFTDMVNIFACQDRTSHFPMQNVEKIRFRISSAVVAPVIASIGRKAA
jgi:hypothetical protein